MPEVPVWVQEYMLTAMETQLAEQQYMYAAVSARNLVQLAIHDPESLNPQIIDAAQRVQHTLEQKGYTEDVFLDRLVQFMQTDKGEVRRKFQSLDQDIKSVYNSLTPNSDSQRHFGQRFGVNGNPYKNELLNHNMPLHTWRFLTVYLEFVVATILERYAVSQAPVETATLLGLPLTLYETLLNVVFDNQVDHLVNWVVAHDWVRWWLASYANRVIAQFVSYWLQLPNSGDWSNALGENLLGQPPLSLFQQSYWGPIALARVIQNGFTQMQSTIQLWRLSMTMFGSEDLVPALFFQTTFAQMVASSDFVAEATMTVKNILDRKNPTEAVPMPTASTLRMLTANLLQQVCRSVQRQITQDPPLLGAYKYITQVNLCQEMDNLVSQ